MQYNTKTNKKLEKASNTIDSSRNFEKLLKLDHKENIDKTFEWYQKHRKHRIVSNGIKKYLIGKSQIASNISIKNMIKLIRTE